MQLSRVTLAIVAFLATIALAPPTASALAMADAMADLSLAYETIEPGRIRLGDSALIRVTSLDGYLKEVSLPVVPGLKFETLGRSQGMEFISGKPIPASYILIKVTPQALGLYSIPGLTPKSRTLGLEVVTGDEPNPYAWRDNRPKPLPVAPLPLPKGVQLKAGGGAFIQMVIPTRPVYVGESVPIDIDLGVRPGIVTTLNGLPTLTGSDFTLNNLSKQPKRREQNIQGDSFVVMNWHSVISAVKPGDFSLSVETPITAKIDRPSTEDLTFASKMGPLFVQSLYNGIKAKDVTIASQPIDLKVLPLPAQGRPRDFSGAVGDFKVSSDIAPAHAGVGDPLTLRLHVSGAGNFDRVDSNMLDHVEHWKTYPAKSSFKASDETGYRGEKIFEQPLIAAREGDQRLPPLEFSYFNPTTRQYEHARTESIKVTIGASLADSSLSAPVGSGLIGGTAMGRAVARGLRPDHPNPQSTVTDLRPLYLQAPFLAVPTTLALILAGSWLVVRPNPRRTASKSAQRALAELGAAARTGDSATFFELARATLLPTFAARWHLSSEQITAAELKTRLGSASEAVERLLALADEAKYSDDELGSTDFEHWLRVLREQLTGAQDDTRARS
jgi:hypothetical protein